MANLVNTRNTGIALFTPALTSGLSIPPRLQLCATVPPTRFVPDCSCSSSRRVPHADVPRRSEPQRPSARHLPDVTDPTSRRRPLSTLYDGIAQNISAPPACPVHARFPWCAPPRLTTLFNVAFFSRTPLSLPPGRAYRLHPGVSGPTAKFCLRPTKTFARHPRLPPLQGLIFIE